jgi:hypothetical protein
MQRMPAVSRPAWMTVLSGVADRGIGPRKSPVEIVATMGSYVTYTQAAQVSGLRTGPFGRWADSVNAIRVDCAAFARHWQAHNDEVMSEPGPLWVVLGPPPAACPSRRCPRTSPGPGPASSPLPASIPARLAIRTGPAPCWPRSHCRGQQSARPA